MLMFQQCEMSDPCCDPSTCLLKSWAQCKSGSCCHNCTVSPWTWLYNHQKKQMQADCFGYELCCFIFSSFYPITMCVGNNPRIVMFQKCVQEIVARWVLFYIMLLRWAMGPMNLFFSVIWHHPVNYHVMEGWFSVNNCYISVSCQ